MPSSSFPHGYALVIGVGNDLPATISDAKVIHSILSDQQRCGYLTDHIKLLTDTQSTKSNIVSGLNWLADACINDPEATVIIYFSGHGGFMPDYHLVPFGYDVNDLENTALSGRQFTEMLKVICSQKLLILLDCCHAGGMANVKSPIIMKSPVPPELGEILKPGSGRTIIASSKENEYSFTGQPYSIFTRALCEGFSGAGASKSDGYVYVADLAMYVGRVVPELTKGKQHPIFDYSGADNFVIAYYSGGDKGIKAFGASKQDVPYIFKRKLIDAMLACSTMVNRQGRESVVGDLPDEIKNTISRSDIAKVDIANIVARCMDFFDGVDLLAESLRFYEGTSAGMNEIDAIIHNRSK